MKERATLRLETGEELGVEVERDDLDREEILVPASTITPALRSGCSP
jgi:hypothetical protein